MPFQVVNDDNVQSIMEKGRASLAEAEAHSEILAQYTAHVSNTVKDYIG